MSNLIDYVKCTIIFCTLMRDGVWLGRRKIQCARVTPSRVLAFSRLVIFLAPFHCERLPRWLFLCKGFMTWDSLAGCSSRHLRVERGTTATFQADSHMTRVLDIVGTVTYGDKWNIKVGSEREKYTYRPVTRLKQWNNGNKLNICFSLVLFMIMLTLLCV